MPSTITAEKTALRRVIRAVSLSPSEKVKSDKLLLDRFLALPQVMGAASVLLFYGVDIEPDTAQLLEPLVSMGKTVALPRCLPDGKLEARRYLGQSHLSTGPYGIPEPDSDCPVVMRDSFDMILVPNLCCDRLGYRLGHGGGYYDRYLFGYAGFTIALCRDKLLQFQLPHESHDVPVGLVVTESQCLSPFSTGKSGA